MAVIIENQQDKMPLVISQMQEFVVRLMDYLDLADKYVSILLVDDQRIRQLNLAYREKDKPTNVLSFPMNEGDASGINPDILGDIVISAEGALRDAEESGLSGDEQIKFYLIHGLLHLTGYDHERGDDQEAYLMQQKEREIFLDLAGIKLETA